MSARSKAPRTCTSAAAATLVALVLGAGASLSMPMPASPQSRARGASPRRSTAVYPPRDTRVAGFEHRTHVVDRGMRCVECHANAGRSRSARDDLGPTVSTCLPCHERATSPWMATLASTVTPRTNLRFSHALHDGLGIACVACHVGVATSTATSRSALPSMRQCFACHAPRDLRRHAVALPPGTSALAGPSGCDTCHLAQPDGVLTTELSSGSLLPPPWMRDSHHGADWIVRHRWVAADRSGFCGTCHRESECVACHDGSVRPRRVHPGDFLTTHGAAAMRDASRCTTCHQQQDFCAVCHDRIGVSQSGPSDPRSPARFHPAGFASRVRGPQHHAIVAARNLSACASCHVERDCVSCHAELGLGGGISPHPPGFARQCAGLVDRGARACRQCHSDMATLRARCR
ncbi:MAG: cytochrome c3 family protein [Deltaproteobacteria bacterium]|nr:cytochrome c3 family protein [Deltaproteobacteria bacterium]